jgi:hypothetical protein
MGLFALGVLASGCYLGYLGTLFGMDTVATLRHWDEKDCRVENATVRSCDSAGVKSDSDLCAQFCLLVNVTYDGVDAGKTVALNVSDPCGFETRYVAQLFGRKSVGE